MIEFVKCPTSPARFEVVLCLERVDDSCAKQLAFEPFHPEWGEIYPRWGKRRKKRASKLARRAQSYLSPGLSALNATAATAPPAKLATKKTQMLATVESPIMVMPTATAGLNAPPETAPTE